jgi:hypothetical protein
MEITWAQRGRAIVQANRKRVRVAIGFEIDGSRRIDAKEQWDGFALVGFLGRDFPAISVAWVVAHCPATPGRLQIHLDTPCSGPKESPLFPKRVFQACPQNVSGRGMNSREWRRTVWLNVAGVAATSIFTTMNHVAEEQSLCCYRRHTMAELPACACEMAGDGRSADDKTTRHPAACQRRHSPPILAIHNSPRA